VIEGRAEKPLQRVDYTMLEHFTSEDSGYVTSSTIQYKVRKIKTPECLGKVQTFWGSFAYGDFHLE
jgi:hypothetical protein